MDKNNVINYAGDYPEFGCITYDHKDPYEAWTDRHHRRNWGEMVCAFHVTQSSLQVQIDMMKYRADRLTFTGLDEEDYT